MELRFEPHWWHECGTDWATCTLKDGWHAPSNTDQAGQPIQNLQGAQSYEYPVFGGFFLAPKAGTSLAQTFPL